jgi:hypothetical protein
MTGSEPFYYGIMGSLGVGLVITTINIVAGRHDKKIEVKNAAEEKIRTDKLAADEKVRIAEIAAAKSDGETASAIKELGGHLTTLAADFNRHCGADDTFQARAEQEQKETTVHLIRLDERLSTATDGIKYLVGKFDDMARAK